MTPEEWERCADPLKMLHFLRGKVSHRKLRLVAVACCRRIWHRMWDSRGRLAVELAEQYADDSTNGKLRTALGQAAADVFAAFADRTLDESDRVSVYAAAHAAYAADPDGHTGYALLAVHLTITPGNRMVQAATCKLVRETCGIPFRPQPTVPDAVLACNGGAAPRLAESIYTARRFEDLPVLADLLEEAGLTDAGLLGHLRGPGPHALGCWALVVVLLKA
jgi:hypothetical protein